MFLSYVNRLGVPPESPPYVIISLCRVMTLQQSQFTILSPHSHHTTTDSCNSAHRQSPTSSSASDSFIDPIDILPQRPTLSVPHRISQDESLESGHPQPENVTFASESFGLITVQRRTVANPVHRSPELIKAGKRKIFVTKWLFIGALVAIK